ncbi:MAG: hypothetical protein M3460_10005 [Actinomycetota bacterium]|nr:hypothetical protein [Actinomycetota bacterium]
MTAPAGCKVAVLDMDIRNPETGDRQKGDPQKGDRQRGGQEKSDWSGRVHRVDCYALGSTDLTRYAALIIAPNADQEHLARHRRMIRDYLDSGGVVIFGGHLHRDWLPGASAFVPLMTRSLAGYRVVEVADHPIFRGMGPVELTFRRGVAGFFARGHHPIPAGAEVLTRLSGGQPSTYLDRVSTRGTIVVQATSDLLGCCGDALLDWVVAESAQRRSVAAHRPRGLAAVYGGSAQHHRTLTEPKYAQHLTGGLIYLPELADTDLTAYRGLLIPERLHRGLLDRAADRIVELLDTGGTVIVFSGGEPIPEFLPGVRWQHQPTNFWWWLEPGADLGVRIAAKEHPLFQRLTIRDCTWHYHGVLEPPDGAQVLVRLTTGEALLYVDQVSTAGTIVVSTLDPISHYGGYFMPATERFLDGFMPWAAEAVEV